MSYFDDLGVAAVGSHVSIAIKGNESVRGERVQASMKLRLGLSDTKWQSDIDFDVQSSA